jgi:hypothetical protein
LLPPSLSTWIYAGEGPYFFNIGKRKIILFHTIAIAQAVGNKKKVHGLKATDEDFQSMLFFLKSKEKPYSKSSGKEVKKTVIKIKTFIKKK